MGYSSFSAARREVAHAFDRERLSAALVTSGGVVLAAARALGIPGTYYYARAKETGLDISAVRASIEAAKRSATASDDAVAGAAV